MSDERITDLGAALRAMWVENRWSLDVTLDRVILHADGAPFITGEFKERERFQYVMDLLNHQHKFAAAAPIIRNALNTSWQVACQWEALHPTSRAEIQATGNAGVVVLDMLLSEDHGRSVPGMGEPYPATEPDEDSREQALEDAR